MKQTIPFKKSITFNNKFETVTSLNLTHDYTVKDNMVNGTFLISGTTRSTEASLIDEEFSYNVPFEIALSNRIKEETVNLMIDDFNYETNYNDTIVLEINLNLECDEVDEIFEFIDNLSKDDEEDRSEIVDEDIIDNEVNVMDNNKLEEINIEDNVIINNEPVINYNNIYSFISDKKDFVTYKIYFVKENEDYQSISNLFNVSIDELSKYNEIKELKKGDKVIIPYVF